VKGVTVALAMAAAAAALPGGAYAADTYELLTLDGHKVKWGEPVLGTGATVTYGFVDASTHSAGARNCRDMVPLDGLIAAAGVTPRQFRAEAAAAFAMWEAVADVRFRFTDDPDRAQILIGAQAQPRGSAFANVEYDERAGAGTRPIERSLICLSPRRGWKVGFGGNSERYDFRYTLAHEIGHAIGLDHPGPSGQLMSFRYAEAFRGPQPGDIAGAVALYGRSDMPLTVAVPPTWPRSAPASTGNAGSALR
jgi:hypothetical protein